MCALKKAVFAGGSFWCMVKPFHEVKGVKEVVSGYTGGHVINPTSEQVSSLTTGHREAVEVLYDDSVVNYSQLLEVFFNNIDPHDEEGQFNDRGSKYLTSIYYGDEKQKKEAEEYIKNLESTGSLNKPVAVKILKAEKFYPAEDYHQDYYKKNPQIYEASYKNSGRKEFFNS